MATSKALRPFLEASLALFSAGAPPVVVAAKFKDVVSYGTVLSWYTDWAELKGIPLEHRYRARKKNTPRHEYEHERLRKELVRSRRKRAQQRLEARTPTKEVPKTPEWQAMEDARKRRDEMLGRNMEAYDE